MDENVKKYPANFEDFQEVFEGKYTEEGPLDSAPGKRRKGTIHPFYEVSIQGEKVTTKRIFDGDGVCVEFEEDFPEGNTGNRIVAQFYEYEALVSFLENYSSPKVLEISSGFDRDDDAEITIYLYDPRTNCLEKEGNFFLDEL